MYTLRNKVQLIGNLEGSPEIRTGENGKKHARFVVAIKGTYRDDQGKKLTQTQWHHVVAWGKLAKIAEKYLEKGSEVAVGGMLVNRSYTDKHGIKRDVTEVQANELLKLGGKTSK